MSADRNPPTLPAEAIALARRGEMVEAIKLTRERTGLGLQEAKAAVEACIRSAGPASQADTAGVSGDLPHLATRALEQGRLLDAIRHTREATGLGLKDAKEAVERHLEGNPALNARFKAASAADFRRVASTVVFVLALFALLALGYQYVSR